MNHEMFKAEQYKAVFNEDLIVNELETVLSKLNHESFEIEEVEGERGGSLYASPKNIENPFVLGQTTNIENGYKTEYKIGWTILDKDGNIPKGVSSQTAIREDSEKPALFSIIKYVENDSVKYELQEVLFSNENGFDRYVFVRGFLSEKLFFYRKNDEKKIYEVKRPYYVNFHSNGEPKEVWYFNPKAKKFAELGCTVRFSDNHPVVISFHDNGEIHEVDYTGFFFVDRGDGHSLNFPFHSRYDYFRPSYYKYSKLNEFGQKSVVEKYNLNKKIETEESILSVIGGWGVDISNPDIIRQQLDANPMFDKTIRNMLGIGMISDKDIDNHEMISQIKI